MIINSTAVRLAAVATIAAAVPAHAANATYTEQPWTCRDGESTAKVITLTAPIDKLFGIGSTDMAIALTGPDGNEAQAGTDLRFSNTKFSSIGFFFKDTNNSKKYVHTSFCFHDEKGDCFVQNKLSDYRSYTDRAGWTEAVADSRELGDRRVFQADLNRVVITLSSNGFVAAVTMGGITLGQRPERDATLILKDETCQLGSCAED